VDDVMRTGKDMATVAEGTPLTRTILEITSKRLGATCVLDADGNLAGIITDGDLRRLMEARKKMDRLRAKDVMHRNPVCVPSGILAAKALHVMEEFSINQLIVTDAHSRPVGMIHLHDLLKAGLA